MQPCGDCRLCCKLFPLPVLQKPAGQWCRHTCASGCAIHGPQQPDICREYDCYWRDHEDLPESWRPDRIGVVATEAGNVNVGHRLLPVVILQEDDPSNLIQRSAAVPCGSPAGGEFKTASEENRRAVADELLDHLVSQGIAVMIIHGMEARVEFDRARYPHIAAAEIEAALRYELSQDAEELKRLGAVESDYRALSRDEAEAACRDERRTSAS